MVGGFASLGEHKVMVIGTQKGRDTKENILRNFGSAHPEGYRKALRLMRLADKIRLPIITLIDTAGAYPGIGAEERHIAEAIAVNLREMMLLEVPIIAAVIGEGGSGGALGIGVADRVLILENAYYSELGIAGTGDLAGVIGRDSQGDRVDIDGGQGIGIGVVDLIIGDEVSTQQLTLTGVQHRTHGGRVNELARHGRAVVPSGSIQLGGAQGRAVRRPAGINLPAAR